MPPYFPASFSLTDRLLSPFFLLFLPFFPSSFDLGKDLLCALDSPEDENPPKRARHAPPSDDAYPLWEEQEDGLCEELTFLVEKIGVAAEKAETFMSYLS